MDRITQKMLENRVEHLNEITGNQVTPWIRNSDGLKSVPGVYVLDWAYGGVQLQQVESEGGAVSTIIHGFGTKRELFEKLGAYISGVQAAA